MMKATYLSALTLVALAGAVGCTSFSVAPAERTAKVAPPKLTDQAWPTRDSRVMPSPAPEVQPERKLASSAKAGRGTLLVYEPAAEGTTPVDRYDARFVSSWSARQAELERAEVDRLKAEHAAKVEAARKAAAEAQAAKEAAAAPAKEEAKPSDVTQPAAEAQTPPSEPAQPALETPAAAEPAPVTPEPEAPFQPVLGVWGNGVGISFPRRNESPAAPRARGVVLFFDGLGDGADEKPLIETLESRGWAVVRIGTVTKMRREQGVISVRTISEVPAAAAEIATGVDEALAESVYAAEAALEYCASQRPDIPQRPLILAGCSAGALAVPPTAALMSDRVDAAIVIGGGANVLEISQGSDVTDFGIELDWGRQGTTPAERNRELQAEYLQRSKLDPYNTAAYLVNKPVLMVHAVFDGVIPASAGRILHEQLGSPDRIRFTGGYRGMVYFMTDVAPRVATWLDQALSGPRREPAPAAAAEAKPAETAK